MSVPPSAEAPLVSVAASADVAQAGAPPLRRWAGASWPLGLYALLSVALFGGPVLGHLGSRIVAADAIDSSAFMWFFAWWPHALLHGLNPFVTHVIFVPEGYNLTWSTTMPGPSILLSPVTLAFGPAVTWNVIMLCAPALSAWTAFLLCRHVTGATGPSLAGGYVFGFSPYMLIHLTGGPSLAVVALLPALVWLVLGSVQGTIGRRRFVIAAALALTAQFLISTEVLATATLFGALALVVAYGMWRPHRPQLRATARLLLIAYAAMAVLISPFLYFFFFGQHYPPGATRFRADLASSVLPSPLMAISRHAPALEGANTEGYLGLPLVALTVLFLWQRRRSRAAWVLGLTMVAAAVCSVGSHLVIRGQRTSIPAPWLVLGKLPILRYAIPVRLAVFVALPAAVIVAMFLSDTPGRTSGVATGRAWRWGLALLAVAFILPDVGNPAWDTSIHDPAFFAAGTYRRYLRPADNVLTIPAWGPNERWQADTRFSFKLADGYAGTLFPRSYTRYSTWNTLLTGQLPPGYAAALRRFVATKHVTAIVVDETVPGPWATLFGTLGVRPVSAGGVLLYRLGGAASGPA